MGRFGVRVGILSAVAVASLAAFSLAVAWPGLQPRDAGSGDGSTSQDGRLTEVVLAGTLADFSRETVWRATTTSAGSFDLRSGSLDLAVFREGGAATTLVLLPGGFEPAAPGSTFGVRTGSRAFGPELVGVLGWPPRNREPGSLTTRTDRSVGAPTGLLDFFLATGGSGVAPDQDSPEAEPGEAQEPEAEPVQPIRREPAGIVASSTEFAEPPGHTVVAATPAALVAGPHREEREITRGPERVNRLEELVSPVTFHTEERGTPKATLELAAALESAEPTTDAEAARQRRIAEELAWIAQQQQGGEQPAATLAPEPATLLLLASGLISLGIAGILRRRRP